MGLIPWQDVPCVRDLQAAADLALMLRKTADLMPGEMMAAATSPLKLLADCVQDDRQLAVVRKGAAAVSLSHLCVESDTSTHL